MANYTASEYVGYAQLVGDYSYLLAQQAAPYMERLPPDIQSYVNPGVNGTEPLPFSELYTNSTRTLMFTTQYGFSIALLPIGLFILSLLTQCVFNSVLCSRMCCRCFRCTVKAKKRTKGTTSKMAIAAEAAIAKAELTGKKDERAMRMRDKAETERVHKSITKQRKRLTFVFIVFALLPLLTGTGLAYIAHTYFEEAYAAYDVTIGGFEDTFGHWAASTVALQTGVDSLYRALPNAKAECDATTALDELDEGILELEDALPALNDAVVALQDLTASADTSLAAYLGETRQFATYGFAGLPLIFFILMMAMIGSGAERKHCMNRSSVCCGQCLFFIYGIVAVPMLLITIALSDLCISDAPMLALSDQIPTGALSSNATDLFLGCTNPFTEAINTATDGVVEMHDHILGVLTEPRVSGTTCPDFASGNYWVIDMNTTVTSIYARPDGILPLFVDGDINCPTFKASLTDAVDENVCGSTFNAIFALTVSIIACSITTFLCLMILPALFSHYDYLMKIWDEQDLASAYQDDDTDSEDDLDPDELLDKPGEMDGNKDVTIYEETKEEEDDNVSKVTEFDWTSLDLEGPQTGAGAQDPHYNPNSMEAQGRRGHQDFDGFDLESLGETVKTVEDTVHYEAINDAGYEDDL